MDKVLELCFRSIIRDINGDMKLSRKYKELALEIHYDINCIARVEDHVPRQTKIKLYELVS